MLDNIIVRKATSADLPALLKFEQGIISTEKPFDETLISEKFHYYDLAARIEDSEAEVVVAQINGNVIGSGSAVIKEGNPYNKFTRYAFLGFMYVVPDHRGKAVNQMIIQKLVEWSHARGLKEIRLQVYSENAPAIKAYEKVGFKKILTEMRLTY